MEFRRRSLWNRVWDGESLDIMGHEEYARRVYEGEGYQLVDRWREVGYGLALSAWKGVQWLWSGFHWRRWQWTMTKARTRSEVGAEAEAEAEEDDDLV